MNRYSKLIRQLIASTIPDMASATGAPTSKTSLSSSSTSSSTPKTSRSISDYERKNLTHAPNLSPITSAALPIPTVEPLNIKVTSDKRRPTVPGFLHLSERHSSIHPPSLAAILLSGAGGGVVGPSAMYLSIADKLASLDAAIPVLRLDFRYPAMNKPCCADVTAAMDYLESAFGIQRFALVGWSFGGAPVFTVAANDERVVCCATVASQTAETEGVRRLAPRPLLLLHGTGDRTLSPWCSQQLYEMYGTARGGERTLKMFEDDDHALTGSSKEAEKLLCDFIVRCAGARLEAGEERVIEGAMVEGKEKKVEIMRRGGDLRGEESVE